MHKNIGYFGLREKRNRQAPPVAFLYGQGGVSTSQAAPQTPPCPSHSKPMANAIRLLRAHPRSKSAAEIRPEELLLNKLHHQKIKHTFAKNFEVWRQA